MRASRPAMHPSGSSALARAGSRQVLQRRACRAGCGGTRAGRRRRGVLRRPGAVLPRQPREPDRKPGAVAGPACALSQRGGRLSRRQRRSTGAAGSIAERSIRVNVSAVGSPLRSLDFITLRIKDAVCDKLRSQTGRRPSVDTADPDVRIHAFFDRARLHVVSGHQRRAAVQARVAQGVGRGAAAREPRRRASCTLSGWEPGTPLLDPMCGGAQPC